MNPTNEPRTEKALVITRTFDAPVALVWRAWTEPEHFMKWWGPTDFTSPSCRMDVREGGKYVWAMRSPDGQDMFSTGVFREIVPHQRLVFTDNFADADGNVVSGAAYGMAADFPETVVTVTFEERDGRTIMTMRQEGLPNDENFDMTQDGWSGSFDKLAASLQA